MYGQSKEIQNSKELLAADKVRALHEATEIHRRVMEGEDFEELARQYSDLPTAADGRRAWPTLPYPYMAGLYERSSYGVESWGSYISYLKTPIGFQFFKLVSIQEEVIQLTWYRFLK